MKVLVCGGRDYDDFTFLDDKLTELAQTKEGITKIIHGGAEGADQLAGDWAHMNIYPCSVYPANWYKYKKAAGPIRNRQMLDFESPDVVVAFPGGPGTANMVMQAKARGIKVIDYGRSENTELGKQET